MKYLLVTLLISLASLAGAAQTTVAAFPKTSQTLLTQFRSSQDPTAVFAAAVGLVKNPPARATEPLFLNLIIQNTFPLKTVFSAVILTSMGAIHEELTPLLQDAAQSEDPLVRAYGAGAYALVYPQDKTHVPEVVRLFVLDQNLAQRAMNLLAQTDKEQLAFLKKAAADTDPSVRAAAVAWLGTLHTPQAAQVLLKRAKTETDTDVQPLLSMALAKQADFTLPGLAKGLSTPYQKPAAATYALALGFCTGYAVDTLKTALDDKNANKRLNALRAAAYMAGVLATPDAFNYSSDREFDIRLLKGLVPSISALAQNGSSEEKTYAQTTLTQIEKLL